MKLSTLFRLFWFLLPILSFSFADVDAGGDDTDPPPAPPATPPPSAGLQSLISRHNNDLMAVIHTLFSENYQYREDKRALKQQLKDAQGKQPPESAVILSKEEAELFDAYKELGDIETVKRLQGELQTTQEQLGALQREGVLRDVADVAGYKLPVLKRLGETMDYEIRETENDGQKAKAAFVKNGEGQFTPLADYAQANWADFLPALQAEPPEPPKRPGTQYPSQNPGGPPPAKNLIGDFIKEANDARTALPNPLVSKK